MKKLDNQRFVENAPSDVLELERKKKSDADSKIKSIEERIKELKSL
jgi:valyl-tRNA synthetase